MNKPDQNLVKTAEAIRKGHQQTEARVVSENAVRWCNNILAEVLHNYGEHLPAEDRIKLKAMHSHTQAYR